MSFQSIEIPPQPEETSKFKRGEHCFLRRENSYPMVKVVEHYDWEQTYRVLDSRGEIVVREDELLKPEEHADEIEIARKIEEARVAAFDRKRFAEVVNMWNAGLKTPVEMARSTGTKPICWVKKIEACKRRGYFK